MIISIENGNSPSLYLTFEEWRFPLSLLSNADADADAEYSEEADFFSSVFESHWGIFFLESLWNSIISSSADAIFFFFPKVMAYLLPCLLGW